MDSNRVLLLKAHVEWLTGVLAVAEINLRPFNFLFLQAPAWSMIVISL